MVKRAEDDVEVSSPPKEVIPFGGQETSGCRGCGDDPAFDLNLVKV